MPGFRKRTYAGFKRKRTGYAKRPFKRRRLLTRGRRNLTFGNRADRTGGLRFKARKWSRRRWNRALWNSTQQKSHYRVAAAWIDTITTPADATLGQVTIYQAQDNGTARFWTSGGGAIDVDGGTIGNFTDDMILRGGKLKMTMAFVDAVVSLGDQLSCKVWLIKAAENVNLTSFNSAARSSAWDPSMFPEFRETIGRIIFQKEFTLGPVEGDSRTFEHRLTIQKIDQAAWTSLSTGRHYWVVQANNPTSNNATSATLHFSMNMSFSGDNIG